MQMLNMLQGMQASAASPTNRGGMQPMGGGAAMGSPQQFMPGMPGQPQPNPGSSDHTDWMKTVEKTCSMLDSIFKTAGGFNDMMGKFD